MYVLLVLYNECGEDRRCFNVSLVIGSAGKMRYYGNLKIVHETFTYIYNLHCIQLLVISTVMCIPLFSITQWKA